MAGCAFIVECASHGSTALMAQVTARGCATRCNLTVHHRSSFTVRPRSAAAVCAHGASSFSVRRPRSVLTRCSSVCRVLMNMGGYKSTLGNLNSLLIRWVT